MTLTYPAISSALTEYRCPEGHASYAAHLLTVCCHGNCGQPVTPKGRRTR